MTLSLSNASNATIARGEGSGALHTAAAPQSLRDSAADSAGDGTMLTSSVSGTLSISGGTATEGGCLAFAVTLSNVDPSATVAVYYGVYPGSASPDDFTWNSVSLTFSVSGTQYLYVDAVDDAFYEGDESFYVEVWGEGRGGASATGVHHRQRQLRRRSACGGVGMTEGETWTADFLVTLSNPTGGRKRQSAPPATVRP